MTDEFNFESCKTVKELGEMLDAFHDHFDGVFRNSSSDRLDTKNGLLAQFTLLDIDGTEESGGTPKIFFLDRRDCLDKDPEEVTNVTIHMRSVEVNREGVIVGEVTP